LLAEKQILSRQGGPGFCRQDKQAGQVKEHFPDRTSEMRECFKQIHETDMTAQDRTHQVRHDRPSCRRTDLLRSTGVNHLADLCEIEKGYLDDVCDGVSDDRRTLARCRIVVHRRERVADRLDIRIRAD
jgi:hypothetical protein